MGPSTAVHPGSIPPAKIKTERPLMRHLLPGIACSALLGCFPGTSRAVVESEDGVSHFYGSKSRPGLEIEIGESEGSPAYLHLEVLATNGVELRASTGIAQPANSRKTKDGSELAGTSRLHGREFRYRANLSRDRGTLEILEPKSILLADGSSLDLAGRYGDLSEKARAAAAKAAFDPIDKELNAIYAKTMASLDPAGQEKLRAEQRGWLKYRDVSIYDGDNSGIIGPGTAPHFRQQGRRTLERIRFLQSISAQPPPVESSHILYADGRGGTCAIGRVDDAVFFSIEVEYPHLRDSAQSANQAQCAVSGVARSAGENIWLAKTEDMAASSDDGGDPVEIEALRLVLDPTGVLRVEAAGTDGPLARAVGGSYHRLRAAAPAEEPLRSLLLQSPETAFEETTEGLNAAEKKSLALTGTGGTFKIEKETRDDLVLRHHDGTVELRRLRGADGSVVVAVKQTNGPRNHVMQLWRKTREGAPFKPWENALSMPPVEKFFDGEPNEDAAKIKDQSHYMVRFEEGTRLVMSLHVPHLENREPDYCFSLDWDGYGFAVERMKH